MKKKLLTITIVVITILIFVLAFLAYRVVQSSRPSSAPTTTSSVGFVNSTITASGAVTAVVQVKLNFQIPGKLTYLPFKEGDKIKVGQVIARLDSSSLQKQLTASLNTYRSTRDNFDQTVVNNADSVLKPTLSASNTDAVNAALKRLLDQTQAGLDNSVISVELAKYALDLSTLTSPLSGIVTHEDVSVSGVNITPSTSFTVADPANMVFRANVPTSSIFYIKEGGQVSLAIDGIENKLSGTVTKIYPSKVTMASGSVVYQVDIYSDELAKQGKLDVTGTAIISTNSQDVALVPAWIVLGGKYIWLSSGNGSELRAVTVGKSHDNQIEIISGLSSSDRIIIDPKYLTSLTGGYLSAFSSPRTHIDNSQIQAPVITISPTVQGKVQSIDAKEGQLVEQGDTLAVVGSETIRTDTDGLIISAPDLTGSTVSPNTQLIQMIRPSSMRVAGTIDENKGLSKLEVGQVVSFTVDALPGKTFWGYLDEISPSARTSAFSFSTSTERTTQQFSVYTKFDANAYPAIKNGMSAKMTVYTK